jgi:RNA polymerase sigma factor (sigma-70 family)
MDGQVMSHRTVNWRRLFAEHHAKLRSWIASKVNDWELADDLAGEVWVRLVNAEHRQVEVGNWAAYMHTVAQRLVIDHYRARGKAQHVDWEEMEYALPCGDFADDTHAQIDAQVAIRRAHLTDKQIEVLALYVDGYRYDALAAALDVSVETVKARRHRAIEKLQKVAA